MGGSTGGGGRTHQSRFRPSIFSDSQAGNLKLVHVRKVVAELSRRAFDDDCAEDLIPMGRFVAVATGLIVGFSNRTAVQTLQSKRILCALGLCGRLRLINPFTQDEIADLQGRACAHWETAR